MSMWIRLFALRAHSAQIDFAKMYVIQSISIEQVLYTILSF